jgi:DUF971 family protein
VIKRPSQIKYHRVSHWLEVVFDDARYELPAEYLRVYSPSAEVRGHGGGEPLLILEKENVGISRIDAVGNYAVRLYFSDGHSTGLYSWDVLRDLGENQAAYWTRYLERLAEAGIQRQEPA